jgi:hypothetical protein
MTETAPPFKSPLSQEALRQIHAVTGRLIKEGEEVDASTMKSLVGELLLNMQHARHPVQHGVKRQASTAACSLQ